MFKLLKSVSMRTDGGQEPQQAGAEARGEREGKGSDAEEGAFSVARLAGEMDFGAE